MSTNVSVTLVYDIEDEDGRTSHVEYTRVITRVGLVEVIAAIDEYEADE